MNRWQKDVRAFQRLFKFSAPAEPTLPTAEMVRLRQRLVAEECRELLEALGDNDLPAVAAECVDLIYVTVGTAVSLGIDLSPHWRAVHAANMRKAPPERLGEKARKPSGWKAPDHVALLVKQVGRRWWQWW